MSSFSPTDAALEGVRLSRERPRTVLVWSAYYFAFTFLLAVLAFVTLGAKSAELLREAQETSSDPEEFDRLLRQIWPFFALGYPILVAFQVMFTAALYRTILSPDHHPNITLRIGGDEFRLFAVGMIKTLALIVFLSIGSFLGVFYGIGDGPLLDLLGLIVRVGLVCVFVLVWIRFSLSGPATCAKGRLVVFESWSLTRGHFWKILISYVMALFVAVVLLLVMLIISEAVLFSFSFVLKEAVSKLVGLVVFLFGQASNCFIFIAFLMIVLAPGAQIYRDLTTAKA